MTALPAYIQKWTDVCRDDFRSRLPPEEHDHGTVDPIDRAIAVFYHELPAEDYFRARDGLCKEGIHLITQEFTVKYTPRVAYNKRGA